MLRLWDPATRSPRLLPVPDVASVAMSRDGHGFAYGQADGVLHVTLSGGSAATLRAPAGGADTLAFSRDGRTIAAGGARGAIRVWRGASLAPVGSLSRAAAA